MRLPNLISIPRTPADLFVSRYKWLSRWAMHFARNDRTAAEDLIQDTYLRFTQADLNIEDIRDAEALLYTYLQYVHLAHCREIARHSFTSLAEARLDALALGLPTGPDVDRIETQNVLRRIAAYVAWRKQTSKSASVVALRFFHGYLPEEIGQIALVSRAAVDERLHKGRCEIRLHLLDPERQREIQHGGPPQIFPSKFAVSTDELLGELRVQVFRAPIGACMSSNQLLVRYRNGADVPIRKDLLAHIVSCASCLATVEEILRKDRRSGHSGMADGMMGNRKPGSRGELPFSSARNIENVVRRSERKLMEIVEHRPTSIIVAVNGKVLASRDVGASFNGLKVEVIARDLEFIEILNEYGVSLLSWVIQPAFPHSDPVIRRLANFSEGRSLAVELHTFGQGLVIDVQYHDPSYRDLVSPSFASEIGAFDKEDEVEAAVVEGEPSAGALFGQLLIRRKWFRLTPLTSTAFVCAALAAVSALLWRPGIGHIRPTELLQRASTAEHRSAQSAKGIIRQQVRIRTSQGAFERTTYSDPERRHRLKQQALDEKKQQLKMRLAEAGIDWDAPLGAASLEDWMTQHRIQSETVQEVSENVLTLRVDVEGSDVEQETISLRATDFHPIEKTVQFRDLGTVDIAELNYAVVPWSMVDQDAFERGDSRSVELPAGQQSLPPGQRHLPLSAAELDMTELEVRTALHDLHADSSDRLKISRSIHGLQVNGLIEDEKEKSEIKRRLDFIPHVSTHLATIDEAGRTPGKSDPSTSVQIVSEVAEPSLLEAFLMKEGKTREGSSDVTDRLFSASTSLLRADKALSQLEERFPRERLSPDALNLYDGLLNSWKKEFETALSEESAAIQLVGIELPKAESVESGSADTGGEIERNRALLKQLIGRDAPVGRSAPDVVTDLARSIELLRKEISHDQDKGTMTLSPGVRSAINAHP